MAKQEQKTKNNPLVKIYLASLFLCGIILGFSFQSRNSSELGIDKQLDNSLITALTTNGVGQENVVSQFVRERNVKGKKWDEYYKTIKLPENIKSESFEPVFSTLARNFKLDLSENNNAGGSSEYTFSSNKRIYSKVIFLREK